MSILRWRSRSWTTTTTCLCSSMACARPFIRTSSSPARESMTCWSTEGPRSSPSFPSSSSPSRVSLGGCLPSWFTNHTQHSSFSQVTPHVCVLMSFYLQCVPQTLMGKCGYVNTEEIPYNASIVSALMHP